MNIFTVSLFGHRKNENIWRLEPRLTREITELIQNKPYVAFLIGRNGEFDEYAASIIKRIQTNLDRENSDLTLVLPYRVADMEYYKNYYDNIVIPDTLCNAHPKSAITLRNRWMVEHSDLLIFFIEHNKGGTYQAWKYAKRIGKPTLRLQS